MNIVTKQSQQVYKRRLLTHYFLGFLLPPPSWFLLNWLSGTFDLEMVLTILFFPSIYLYISLFLILAYRMFSRRVGRLERHLLSPDPSNEIRAHKDLIFLQRFYFVIMALYVLPGPVVVMANIYDRLGLFSYLVAWISAVPLILIYTSPFTIGFLKNLALFAADLPFSSRYRGLRISQKINLILGQNAVGIVLVLLLTVFHLEHHYGGNEDFSSILMFRLTLIGVSSLVIIIINLFLFFHGVSKPITQLRDSLNQLGGGAADLTLQLEILSRDELGEMAFAFNRFVQSIRAIVEDSRGVAERLLTSAQEITDLTQEFTENAHTQYKNVDRVAESARTILSSVEGVARRSVDQAQKVSTFVEMLGQWDQLTHGMSEKLKGVTQISENTANKTKQGDSMLKTTGESIRVVDESAREITDVVSIIQEISEKIDLLALNAAIEAARAGDVGRGFAVVAEEISRLSERTSGSIGEIHHLVMKNNDQVRLGVQSVESTLQIIGEIMDDTQSVMMKVYDLDRMMNEQVDINRNVQREAAQVKEAAEEIKQSTNMQIDSIESVSTTMQEISRISHQISDASTRLMKDAQDNEGMARQLKKSVEIFKL